MKPRALPITLELPNCSESIAVLKQAKRVKLFNRSGHEIYDGAVEQVHAMAQKKKPAARTKSKRQ